MLLKGRFPTMELGYHIIIDYGVVWQAFSGGS